MKRIQFVFFCITLTTFFACQEDVAIESILGNWKAIELIEDDKSTNLAERDVSFNFYENGTYLYDSNNSYQEAGPFRIQGQMLYTIDTVADGRLEKSVKLAVVKTDSLTFDMNRNGVAQTLKLIRR